MSVFDWRSEPLKCPDLREPEPREKYPQAAYYHRKKAGLTGTRQNPDRHWRRDALQQLQPPDA